jgi:hypothetical protein
MTLLCALLRLVRALCATRATLIAENLALRQQLRVLLRQRPRPRLRLRDRLFWVWLSRWFSGWRSWLTIVQPATEIGCLASIDFLVGPTITFRLLYGFIVLLREQRRVIHFNVTTHPNAAWVSRQLREAFPFDAELRYLIRDRDSIYGEVVRRILKNTGIEEVLIAPRSPWQTPFVERLIGSIRRECLDHVIVLNERHLGKLLSGYLDYYHRSGTHMALNDNTPEPRPIEPLAQGEGGRRADGWRPAPLLSPSRVRKRLGRRRRDQTPFGVRAAARIGPQLQRRAAIILLLRPSSAGHDAAASRSLHVSPLPNHASRAV